MAFFGVLNGGQIMQKIFFILIVFITFLSGCSTHYHQYDDLADTPVQGSNAAAESAATMLSPLR